MEINESRPKLMKFNIKKNKKKWTLKDVENNKNYYMKINNDSAEYRLNNFLQSVNAKDDIHPKSKNPMDFANLVQRIMNGEDMQIWIPANKIDKVKKTYFTEEKYITMKEFLNNKF